MELTKVRNLFYKPKWFDGKKIDNGIDIYTRWANFLVNPAELKLSPIERWKLLKLLSCSHVESWTPDDDGEFTNVAPHCNIISNKNSVNTLYYGQCFTSTMIMNSNNNNEDNKNGIVMRPASDILEHPERWFYSEYTVPKPAMEHSMAWCKEMVANNQGYDMDDIWKFLQINTKKRIQDIKDGKMICSGATWAAGWKYWEWIWGHWEELKRHDHDSWYKPLCELFANRPINLIMSPLLLAIWQYQAGMHFYECKDGSLII